MRFSLICAYPHFAVHPGCPSTDFKILSECPILCVISPGTASHDLSCMPYSATERCRERQEGKLGTACSDRLSYLQVNGGDEDKLYSISGRAIPSNPSTSSLLQNGEEKVPDPDAVQGVMLKMTCRYSFALTALGSLPVLVSGDQV